VNGLELFLLGRKLMKIGEDAIHTAGYFPLPTSVRSIMADIFEHQNTSIGEISARTGFPQSHVSAAVARLRSGGALITSTDPHDRRRTLVRISPQVTRRAAQPLPAPIDTALAAALGTHDAQEIEQTVTTLEALAQRINRRSHAPGLV
jgi:DNA-binding MarR family transcriptional regulator